MSDGENIDARSSRLVGAAPALRGAARSAAAPLPEARARHPRHPHRLRDREVPRVPRGHAADAARRGRRVPGHGGDARPHQEQDAAARAAARPGRRARPEDEIDPREALIRRLLEYQKYKQARRAARGARGGGARRVPARRARSRRPTSTGLPPLAEIPLFALVDAFQRVLDRSKVKLSHDIVADRISLTRPHRRARAICWRPRGASRSRRSSTGSRPSSTWSSRSSRCSR